MKLRVDERGSGESTILFLHGLGVSGWMWTEQLEALAAEAHCLNVDLPGNGESHLTPWTSFADTVDAVAAVIRERAQGGQAHVVGMSLGGYVGVHLLARHPELVASLLVSGVTARPFRLRWLWRIAVEAIILVSRFELPARLAARAMQLPDDVAPLLLRDIRNLSPTTLRRVYAEVLQFSLPPSLADCQTPVLAVAGASEAKGVLSSLDEFLGRLRNARCALAPGGHHAWNAELPELFTSMVRVWTERQELPEGLVSWEIR